MLQHNYRFSTANNGYLEVDFMDSVHNEGKGSVHIHIVQRGYDHSKNNGVNTNRDLIYPIVSDEKITIPENVLPTLITILQKIKF